MKIALLQVGRTSDKYLVNVITTYEERVRRYLSFEILTIPDVKCTSNMPASQQMAREGKKILHFLRNEDYIVALDEKGKEFSTLEFSSWLEKILMLHRKRIVFVIGGAWGLTEEVLRKADMRLSLSRLTFSHQIVRLLFLEQLYRALSVIKGEPYHHE